MTLSMQKALECLNTKQGQISYEELGFILTVLRDNAENDSVCSILDSFVKQM